MSNQKSFNGFGSCKPKHIYFICLSNVVFVAKHVLMLVDCVVLRCFQGQMGHIHSHMVICHTVDVYLGRKSNATCVSVIPDVFYSKAKARVMLYTVAQKRRSTSCFFFLKKRKKKTPPHILVLKISISLLQSSLNFSCFAFLLLNIKLRLSR